MSKKTTLPDSKEKHVFVQDMFNRIAKRYDMMNTLLTFGLDKYWRSKSLKALNKLALPPTENSPTLIADFACGTGDFTKKIQKHKNQIPKTQIPKSQIQVLGLDFSQQMLKVAKKRTEQEENAGLICADILSLPIKDKSFDGAVMGFALRNLIDVPASLKEISRTLKQNAPLCLLEIGIPKNRIVRFLHSFYFSRLVPFVGKILSDSTAYKYLPESVAFLPTPDALKTALKSAGFEKIEVHTLSGNIATLTIAINV